MISPRNDNHFPRSSRPPSQESSGAHQHHSLDPEHHAEDQEDSFDDIDMHDGTQSEAQDDPPIDLHDHEDPPIDSRDDDEDNEGEQHPYTPPIDETEPELPEECSSSNIEVIDMAKAFIKCLEDAELDNGDLGQSVLEKLLDPEDFVLQFDPVEDRALILCIKIYLIKDQTVWGYAATIKAIQEAEAFPDEELLSWDQMKCRMKELSGVEAIKHDMCPNTCLAFTGPFTDLDSCPECSSPRQNADGTCKQAFDTVPVGPSIQAMKRNPECAEEMEYFYNRTKECIEEVKRNGFVKDIDDICCGTDIMRAVEDGTIKKGDTILMLSMDGVQLYWNKSSDCWIAAWIVVNFRNDLRYKKVRVIVGCIIPGPNKPKHAESFLFPSLHHVAAINKRGGLPVWDARRDSKYLSNLFILFGLADSPGMIYFSGMVGHNGKNGCRYWCGLIGRHRASASTYYPALAKPDDSDIEGCDHDDIPYNACRPPDSARYKLYLDWVCNSPTQTEYEVHRRESGICKPSIFLDMPEGTILGIPEMLPGDIMHLILNVVDALIGLWRGTFDCHKDDSIDTWVWTVLKGDVWKEHGADVEKSRSDLPGSFDCPPRNPAEKINSGYKCWEWLMYIFGLAPALLYGVLPDEHWDSFCKLVAGFRIFNQRSISKDQLRRGHKLLIDFTEEYEKLYYQRKESQLHFCRQSIHRLSHLGPEAARIGPALCYSQWSMESSIGYFTSMIRQDSTPYANLSALSVRHAQNGAVLAMITSPNTTHIPKFSKPVRNAPGYILCHPTATKPSYMSALELDAFAHYLDTYHPGHGYNRISLNPSIIKWSRLHLRNGEIARSYYKESTMTGYIRKARNVKIVKADGSPEFGEVQYYFRMSFQQPEDMDDDGNSNENDRSVETLAMISRYSNPDANLLRISHGVVMSCSYQGEDDLVVYPASMIEAVVAMVPHSKLSESKMGDAWKERYFVVEKPGLDVADISVPGDSSLSYSQPFVGDLRAGAFSNPEVTSAHAFPSLDRHSLLTQAAQNSTVSLEEEPGTAYRVMQESLLAKNGKLSAKSAELDDLKELIVANLATLSKQVLSLTESVKSLEEKVHAPPSFCSPQHKQEDFPLVTPWYRPSSKDKGESSMEDTSHKAGTTWYIKHEDGSPITAAEADDMRAFMHTILYDLLREGLLAKTWATKPQGTKRPSPASTASRPQSKKPRTSNGKSTTVTNSASSTPPSSSVNTSSTEPMIKPKPSSTSTARKPTPPTTEPTITPTIALTANTSEPPASLPSVAPPNPEPTITPANALEIDVPLPSRVDSPDPIQICEDTSHNKFNDIAFDDNVSLQPPITAEETKSGDIDVTMGEESSDVSIDIDVGKPESFNVDVDMGVPPAYDGVVESPGNQIEFKDVLADLYNKAPPAPLILPPTAAGPSSKGKGKETSDAPAVKKIGRGQNAKGQKLACRPRPDTTNPKMLRKLKYVEELDADRSTDGDFEELWNSMSKEDKQKEEKDAKEATEKAIKKEALENATASSST
ncbi:hypothetical protein D9758_017763 [Tetrapyrgos nigripes]|uniref:Uncharacterized protein n=1 Tax=Tetrapyrgos nigripes TaxID=182062 RepID=A0A8H5C6L0_9AGAR|nr:hypothetical protein D9758_017763 [Tetrapyrgos nigripes]